MIICALLIQHKLQVWWSKFLPPTYVVYGKVMFSVRSVCLSVFSRGPYVTTRKLSWNCLFEFNNSLQWYELIRRCRHLLLYRLHHWLMLYTFCLYIVNVNSFSGYDPLLTHSDPQTYSNLLTSRCPTISLLTCWQASSWKAFLFHLFLFWFRHSNVKGTSLP